MAKRNKFVASQVETSIGNDSEKNTFSYDTNGEIVYYDYNAIAQPFMGPGVVYGANYDSSDQSNLNTIKLIPDEAIYTAVDQYLVIEPTAPDHIHIRAGGAKDASRAELILGGERNKVQVSDDNRSVGITTRPAALTNTYLNTNQDSNQYFVTSSTADIAIGYLVNSGGTDYIVSTIDTLSEGVIGVIADGLTFIAGQNYTFRDEPDYDHQWTFSSDGTLYGPSMGGLIVNGLTGSAENDLYIYASSGQDVFVSNDNTQALVGYRYLPQVDRSSNFTLELSHMGKHIYNTASGEIQLTVPTNASVEFPIGTEIKVVNDSTATLSIVRENTETMILIAEGDAYTNQDITFYLPTNGLATLFKVAANKWILSGFRVND